MNLSIYTLSGLFCIIELDTRLNISKILDIIISNLEPYITFSILSETHKVILNFLKDTDTIEFENYIRNIYNSSTDDHTLYIITEEYYDNVSRTLVEYYNYLKRLNDNECYKILRQPNLSMLNKYLIINVLNHNGRLLSLLNEEFKDNNEMVLAAVNSYGIALRFASEKLKEDKEIVLAAVKNDFNALYYASDILKRDRELIYAAVIIHSYALGYAST